MVTAIILLCGFVVGFVVGEVSRYRHEDEATVYVLRSGKVAASMSVAKTLREMRRIGIYVVKSDDEGRIVEVVL